MLHKIAILITVLFLAKTTAQTNVYFSEKNSQAIRDSINSIKYVNPDKTIEFIFEVLENYSEKRPNLTISSAYMVLSELYQFKGLPDQTVEYLNLAQQEYEKLFKEIPPWQKINMGNSFYGAGRFDKAKELYREAFKIFEQKLLNAGDDIAKQKAQRFGLAVSTNNIGLVERDMENYELAEIQFLKGLEIRKKNLGWGDIAHSYANLTLIYLRWDKLDKVVLFADSTKFALKKYFLPGEKNATTISTYNRYYGLVQWYLGTRMSKLNQKKEALSYYDSAEKYFINNTVGLSDIIYVRSKSLIHFGDLKAALSSVNKGLQLSEEEGFFDDQRRFLKMKTELLASIGDYKSSKETADKLLILNEKKLLNKNNDIFNRK